jgi:hypothetical protein
MVGNIKGGKNMETCCNSYCGNVATISMLMAELSFCLNCFNFFQFATSSWKEIAVVYSELRIEGF